MTEELQFTWNYDDYRAITGREDNEDTVERWSEVVDIIDGAGDNVDEEISATIMSVDKKIKEEVEDERLGKRSN